MGAGVVAFLLPSLWKGSGGSSASAPTEIPTLRRDEPPANNRNVPVASNANTATATPSPPPVADSTDEELSRLRLSRINMTPSQLTEIEEEMEAAENKYPTDYRFPYEHSKLLVPLPGHHKAFEVLFEAGRKAIKNRQAERMLSNLESDRDGDFSRLSRGHAEWTKLEEALRSGEEAALPEGGHHHH